MRLRLDEKEAELLALTEQLRQRESKVGILVRAPCTGCLTCVVGDSELQWSTCEQLVQSVSLPPCA